MGAMVQLLLGACIHHVATASTQLVIVTSDIFGCGAAKQQEDGTCIVLQICTALHWHV
jgi:hypothetical protein